MGTPLKIAATVSGSMVLGMQPYSDALRDYFCRLFAWDWAYRHPGVCFLRDFEDLPERSPFDIDMMAPAGASVDLLNHLQAEAIKLNLFFARHESNYGAFALIIDLSPEAVGRIWSYIEIHRGIRVPDLISIDVAEVSIDHSGKLPTPSGPWRVLILLAQGLKKHRLKAIVGPINSIRESNSDYLSVAASRLSVAECELERLLAEPDVQTPLWTQIETQIRRSKKPRRTHKSRIRDWVFKNIYFLHLGAPLLYTLHGPDGVGKTTTFQLLEKSFARMPFLFCGFHHITGWKYPSALKGKMSGSSIGRSTSVRPSYLRKVLKFVYHQLLPPLFREFWVVTTGYHLYCRRLHGHIYAERAASKLMLIDRYVYDLITKNLVKTQRWGPIHRLFGRLLMPPRMAFVLVDSPDNIRRRKQELSTDEIVRYQSILLRCLKKAGAPYQLVSVGGRTPQEVSTEILQAILLDSGAALFRLTRGWGHAREAES